MCTATTPHPRCTRCDWVSWVSSCSVPVGSRCRIQNRACPTCALRRGEVRLDEVVAAVDEVAGELVRLTTLPSVPDDPDQAWVDGWLHPAYTGFWAASPS